jgi:hypothetical protein
VDFWLHGSPQDIASMHEGRLYPTFNSPLPISLTLGNGLFVFCLPDLNRGI